MLQAGLEAALAKGKDKVTPKHLRAAAPDDVQAPVVRTAGQQPSDADPALERAAQWIAQEIMPGHEASYLALLGIALGKKSAAKVKALVAQQRESLPA